MALPSGIVDWFTYNGDGQRVQKQDSTGTTNHIWDGQKILLETNGGNIIQVVYTLSLEAYGILVSQRRGGNTSLYLFDGLHSTRQLVGSTALVSDSYTYDSFGNTLIASGLTVNPFRYVGGLGYYFDIDTQQSNLRAAIMTPSLGAFSAETRSYLVSGEPVFLCHNRPISLTDPSGLKPGVITFPPPISPSHPGAAWTCWCNTRPWELKMQSIRLRILQFDAPAAAATGSGRALLLSGPTHLHAPRVEPSSVLGEFVRLPVCGQQPGAKLHSRLH